MNGSESENAMRDSSRGRWGGGLVKKCLTYRIENVNFLCVCPLIDDKLHQNIVKVAVEPRAAGK